MLSFGDSTAFGRHSVVGIAFVESEISQHGRIILWLSAVAAGAIRGANLFDFSATGVCCKGLKAAGQPVGVLTGWGSCSVVGE